MLSLQEARRLSANIPLTVVEIGRAYALSGQREKARDILAELQNLSA